MGLLKKIQEYEKQLQNDRKGKVGEAKVKKKLNPLIFGKVDHRYIDNLILVDGFGKSHQIDHVEIRKNGIFCIETKNYIGLILGDETQNNWTQCLYNGKKNQLFNPLKQNEAHAYHINKVIGSRYHVTSVVVMVQNNADSIDCENVVNLSDLSHYLKHFNDGTELSPNAMDDVYAKLLRANVEMKTSEHVKNIKRTQEELKQGICPRCGGKLVERQGEYGTFVGCSNFPRCTFKINRSN